MDDRDLDINDVTDTSGSSASGSSSSIEEAVFKTRLPFVLELHEIRKDNPLMPGSAAVGPTVAKIKKHKKKKKGHKDTSHTSLSTDSQSDASSVAPSSTDFKEEFYDAHESYHAIPENQIPVALAVKMGHSETSQNPKAPELTTSSEPQTTTPVTLNEPSPITKPTSPP